MRASNVITEILKIPLIEMIHLKFGYVKVYADREF